MALLWLGPSGPQKNVHIKSDNAAAIHYINSGRGRIEELADLAKSIRELSIESVAVHLPGKLNITPDALSRFFIDTSFRDRIPHLERGSSK